MCCKPDYYGEYCATDEYYACSQPVNGKDSHKNFTNILTKDVFLTNGVIQKENHQMFAFCPQTKEATCGADNFTLVAAVEKKNHSVSLLFRKGKPSYRRYESCYYQIRSTNSNFDLNEIKNVGDGVRLYIKFTKIDKMNVYLYGGNSRFNAT